MEEEAGVRIHPAGEQVWVEAVALVLEAIVSAPTADTKCPMNGEFPALKSNAPNVVRI